MKKISIVTLQELKDSRFEIAAACHRCGHTGWLDLDLLIERLGPDYPVGGNPAFLGKLVCSRCGQKRLQINLHPPTENR